MDVDDLEGAVNSAKRGTAPAVAEAPKISREEEISFHKGAVSVLVAERRELVQMIQNVEAIMGAHIKVLKEMGVDLK